LPDVGNYGEVAGMILTLEGPGRIRLKPASAGPPGRHVGGLEPRRRTAVVFMKIEHTVARSIPAA
jgi:hypothetical protein